MGLHIKPLVGKSSKDSKIAQHMCEWVISISSLYTHKIPERELSSLFDKKYKKIVVTSFTQDMLLPYLLAPYALRLKLIVRIAV